jgi:hypothetical protein
MIALFSLIILGTSVSYYIMSTLNSAPHYYQEHFAPAVMQACGKGLVNVDASSIPPLNSFLTLQTSDFSCSALPDQLEVLPLDPLQRASLYLLYAMAFTWQITGVSWSGVMLLYLLLFNMTIVAGYLIFRIWLRPSWASLASIVFIFSMLHLYHLPHLRDYAKAPFILLFVAMIGNMVFKPSSIRRYFILSAIAGLAIGIGLGFRMDLLIFIPLFCIIALLLTPYSLGREHWFVPWGALFLFSIVVFLTSFPILQAIASGGNTFHVILLGWMQPFDANLGVLPSPLYEHGYLYLDGYMYTILQSYSDRVYDAGPLMFASAEYDRIGLQYYLDLVSHFPADLMIRAIASMKQVLILFHDYFYHLSIFFQGTPFANPIIQLHHLFRPLAPVSLVMILLVTSFYMIHNLRRGIALVLIIGYLCAYPSLQFAPRHYFHLEWIGIGFVVVLLQLISAQFMKRGQFKSLWKLLITYVSQQMVRKNVIIVLVLVTVMVSSLYGVRWVQSEQVENMINTALEAPKLKPEVTLVEEGDYVIVQPILVHDLETKDIYTDYVRLDFSKTIDANEQFEITWLYDSDQPHHDFTRTMTIDLSSSASRTLFEPVYSSRDYQFVGIKLLKEDLQSLAGMVVVDYNQDMRLLYGFNISAEWQHERRVQILAPE